MPPGVTAMEERRNEWREEFRVAGDQVGRKIRELVREGNARRIIVRKPTGEIIREIPLTQGVAVGALLALIAPVLAAVGAMVALLAEVRIEVVRDQPPGETGGHEEASKRSDARDDDPPGGDRV